MKKNLLAYMCLSAYCGTVWAQTVIVAPVQPETRFEIAQPEENQAIAEPVPQTSPENSNVRHIRSQDLLHEPELLQRALDSAMFSRDMAAVRLLVPLYAQLNQKDEILLQYAQARLAQADGEIDKAVGLYEQILEKQNAAAPVRLDLAQVLLQNHRQKEAQKQLDILAETESLPDDVLQLLQQYQSHLAKQRKWQFSGSLNYLQENNINNAPTQNVIETETGTWTFPKAESARGIAYEFSADKKTPLKGNWSWLLGGQIYGKKYHNKSEYNDLNVGVSTGLAHRNATREWRISPLYEKRWFGGEAYSQQYGVRVQHNRTLSAKWHSFSNARAVYNKHRHRDFLDGSAFSFSQSFQYRANANNVILLGADWMRENAKDKSSAYHRQAVRVGWRNHWRNWESSLNANFAARKYDSPDWFLNQRRSDREYSLYATLAHNKIQWQGLRPKVAWRWNKQNSNHELYRYRKQQLFVEVDKAF